MVRTSHVVLAVLLHVLVLGTLLIGFRCTRKVEPPPVMQATIIDSKPQAPAKAETVEPPKQEVPKEDPRKEQEEQRRLEEERRAREEQELKKAEVQAQRKAEQLQRAEEARKQAADAAKRKKEDDARKAKEEIANREALKKKQQQELEDQLRKQMASEETQRKSAAKTAATLNAQQAWIVAITQKVVPNFNPPPGTPEDFKCRLRVSLLPGGQVVDVKLLESCGNPILDSSVERAVRKSDPLPTPADPSAFERELEFTFVPHL